MFRQPACRSCSPQWRRWGPSGLKELGPKAKEGDRFKQEWKRLLREQAAFSTRGRQQIVPDAT